MKCTTRILTGDAREMAAIPDRSVDLIVTSPPYPMIEMWDLLFAAQDERIAGCIEESRGKEAFELMHGLLDKAWGECDRVLKPGGIACVNIGDATRTLDGDFQLYSNHSRILQAFQRLGNAVLPDILWRKQTNAPNKFLGSGMLPAGAYVTYEHEYILILRKGPRRRFETPEDKLLRRRSAFFWEERNCWFSDIWQDVKGAIQALDDPRARERSAAFPFELPYRLIGMYSLQGDTVLDPFAGTGTTLSAAMACGRNALGVELDPALSKSALHSLTDLAPSANAYNRDRLARHILFAEAREREKGPLKHRNAPHGFPVVTGQEKDLMIREVTAVKREKDGSLIVEYGEGALAVGAFESTVELQTLENE